MLQLPRTKKWNAKKWQEGLFKVLHVTNCWEKQDELISRVAQVGVLPLKSVEACPNRSVGIWLNSYIQLCAKWAKYKLCLLSTRACECSAPATRTRCALYRTDSEIVWQYNTGACQHNTPGEKMHTDISGSCSAESHPLYVGTDRPCECSVNSAHKNCAPGLLPKWQRLGVSHYFQALSIW